MERIELLETLKNVRAIAKGAGDIQLKGMKRDLDISYKGDIDIVTDVDRECEEYIKGELTRLYPDDDILAEESGGGGSASRRWVVDPLDGTTNYAHRYPFFCVSIALEIDGRSVIGCILDPVHKEDFHAAIGCGAFLNDDPISVSGISDISKSLHATGFPYRMWSTDHDNIKNLRRVLKKCQGVRRDGAAALDLCYVACGRIEGFWELGLKPWDTAAGRLIVEEAGGKVTTFLGDDFDPYTDNVVATNGKFHDQLLSLLKKSED